MIRQVPELHQGRYWIARPADEIVFATPDQIPQYAFIDGVLFVAVASTEPRKDGAVPSSAVLAAKGKSNRALPSIRRELVARWLVGGVETEEPCDVLTPDETTYPLSEKVHRGLASVEEITQWRAEWSLRNPVSAYRMAQGELVWDGEKAVSKPEGRPDGGRFITVFDPGLES